ncbi:hypothetical protein BH20ACT2_BH20ACT2_12850 [soil metagenome]
MTVRRIAAYVPDLMDRSKFAALAAEVRFVSRPEDLVGLDADLVVLDLSRAGVLDVVGSLDAARVIGFGSHVEREVLDAARAAGCDEVLARSKFFGRLAELLGT